jgi:hypothetical protein
MRARLLIFATAILSALPASAEFTRIVLSEKKENVRLLIPKESIACTSRPQKIGYADQVMDRVEIKLPAGTRAENRGNC